MLAVAGFALVAMTLWTVVDVATRFALSKPLSGSIDLVESTLVLVVFLALPEVLRRGEQITVDVFDSLIAPRAVATLKLVGALATVVLLALLAWTGWQPLFDALQFGDRKPDLPIQVWWLLAAIEAALLVCLALALVACMNLLRAAGVPSAHGDAPAGERPDDVR